MSIHLPSAWSPLGFKFILWDNLHDCFVMWEQENLVLRLVPMKPRLKSHNETMLGTIFCVMIYVLFVLSTFLSWLLVLFLVSFFSISILTRLRQGGVLAMWLDTYGLLANARLQDVAYVRWAWSEEKLFEMSSIVLCFFVILSGVLLMISRGKCHPEDVPVPNA
jgi:hypothetical protein